MTVPATSGHPLARPGFAAVFAAHVVSQLGDRIHQLALAWWTMAVTGSVAWMGIVLIATSLPTVLLSPMAGALADRGDRRALMMASDQARGAVAAVLAVLAFTGQLSPVLLLIGCAALSALSTLFTPAAMAVVPSLVEPDEVLPATSLMESAVQGAALAGPVLGGLLVAAVESRTHAPGAAAAVAFALNAVSFALSAVLLRALPGWPGGDEAPREPFWYAMGGGLRFLRRDLTVAGVLGCFAAVNVFTMPVILFLPYFANKVFERGAAGLGWMEGALGLGMMLAALFWASTKQADRPFPIVAGGLGGVAASIGLLGLWPTYHAHLLGLLGAGLSMGSVNVVIVAWFQSRVPAEEAGRFFGLMTAIVSALIPLSYAAYGMAGELVSPAVLLTLNAVAVAGLAGLLAIVPGFRDAGRRDA